ncbi:hypothetical protein GCM10028827_02640 [Mucilaginibacter myungsuensis]
MIDLPSHWQYELEEGDLEACFDPNSQSTLRLYIIKAVAPLHSSSEQNIADLTSGLPYIITSDDLVLTKFISEDIKEGNSELTILTWRLIDVKSIEKIAAIITYTVLSDRINSTSEKEAVQMIERSLQTAKFID